MKNKKFISTILTLTMLLALTGCEQKVSTPSVLTPTSTPTAEPVATETSVPTEKLEPTMAPTEAPVATETPVPTATPTEAPREESVWTETNRIESTCTVSGLVTYTDQYGETKTEELPLAAHTHGEPEVIPATVDEEGLVVVRCTVCGEIISSEVLPKLTPTSTPTDAPTPTPEHEHRYTLKETVDPTCSSEGKWTYSCECGDTYEEVIPRLAHDEETVVEPATLEKEGRVIVRCKVCGEVISEEVVPRLTPTPTPEPTKVPTPTPTPTPAPTKTPTDEGPSEEEIKRKYFPDFPEDAKPGDGGNYVYGVEIASSWDLEHHSWFALSDVSLSKMGYRLCDTNRNLIETTAEDWKTTSTRQDALISFYRSHKRTENNKLNSEDCEDFKNSLSGKNLNFLLSETTTLSKSNREIYTVLYWSDFSYVTDIYGKLTIRLYALIPVGDVYYCTACVNVPYDKNEDYKNAYEKALKMIDNLVSYAVIVEN